MKLEVRPSVATVMATAYLVTSIGLTSTQVTPMRVEHTKSARSGLATTMWGGAGMTKPYFVPAPQDYYWTAEWQTQEQRALRELASGQYLDFDDVEDLIAWLDEPEV